MRDAATVSFGRIRRRVENSPRLGEVPVMRALLVGAGSVGQTFGYYLQQGGAEVAFYVRPKHLDECRRGFTLFELPGKRKRRLEGAACLSTLEEVKAGHWDQVYLCMSSTGLRGEWLGPFAAAIGNATVVVLQPALEDRDYVRRFVPTERLVTGMISIVAYHAPLDGESFPESGTAYWAPTLAPTPFSGPEPRTADVVHALRRGGQPAKIAADVASAVAFPGGSFMAALTALETADWSFATLKRSRGLLELLARAIDEVREITTTKTGVTPSVPKIATGRTALKLLLSLSPRLTPFPLETYMRAHFTKVGDQTRLAMRMLIENGASAKLPTAALRALEAGISAKRAQKPLEPKATQGQAPNLV
jgi:2-dehydropantoate 2-reductase